MPMWFSSLKDLTKKYPGVLGLDRVSLGFLEGEVHALLGENAREIHLDQGRCRSD